MADVEKVTEEIEVLSSEVIGLLSKVCSDVQELKHLVARRAHVDCRETCSITKDMATAVSKINLIVHKRESIEGEG